MIDSRWRQVGRPEPGAEHLVVATYFHLRSIWRTRRFLRMTRLVQGQLDATEGLIGYSMGAEPLGKRYWTRSVWRDEHSLARFISRAPHRDAMHRLPPIMRTFRIVRWRTTEVPPSWPDAKRRLSAEASRTPTGSSGPWGSPG